MLALVINIVFDLLFFFFLPIICFCFVCFVLMGDGSGGGMRGGMGSYGVVGLNERVVDGDDVDVIVLNGVSEDDTTNAAETVDSNLCRSHGSA